MIKRASVVAILAMFAATVNAETWKIDEAHSSVGFKVSHLVVSKTKGTFNDFSGTVDWDGKDITTAKADIKINTASIDTDDQKRDEHLKSSDFFAADSFPTMTFVSTKVTKLTDNQYQLAGDLTIREVTRPVILDVEYSGLIQDPWGNTRAGFTAEGKIDRQEFGIKWSKALDGGGLVVGNDVDIAIEVELVKQKPAAEEAAKK